jgi:hypothetical protein
MVGKHRLIDRVAYAGIVLQCGRSRVNFVFSHQPQLVSVLLTQRPKNVAPRYDVERVSKQLA